MEEEPQIVFAVIQSTGQLKSGRIIYLFLKLNGEKNFEETLD